MGVCVMADVYVQGALLDGRAPGIIAAACQQGQDAVAREGLNRVHAQLHDVLRHPTGYYESHVVTDLARNESRVHDSSVIYGPWLEGVGSRNQTTRFKGYFTFRLVTQGLRRDAAEIAEPHMTKLLELSR